MLDALLVLFLFVLGVGVRWRWRGLLCGQRGDLLMLELTQGEGRWAALLRPLGTEFIYSLLESWRFLVDTVCGILFYALLRSMTDPVTAGVGAGLYVLATGTSIARPWIWIRLREQQVLLVGGMALVAWAYRIEAGPLFLVPAGLLLGFGGGLSPAMLLPAISGLTLFCWPPVAIDMASGYLLVSMLVGWLVARRAGPVRLRSGNVFVEQTFPGMAMILLVACVPVLAELTYSFEPMTGFLLVWLLAATLAAYLHRSSLSLSWLVPLAPFCGLSGAGVGRMVDLVTGSHVSDAGSATLGSLAVALVVFAIFSGRSIERRGFPRAQHWRMYGDRLRVFARGLAAAADPGDQVLLYRATARVAIEARLPVLAPGLVEGSDGDSLDSELQEILRGSDAPRFLVAGRQDPTFLRSFVRRGVLFEIPVDSALPAMAAEAHLVVLERLIDAPLPDLGGEIVFEETRTGSWTATLIVDGARFRLASRYDPERESIQVLEQCGPEPGEGVVLFGIGAGHVVRGAIERFAGRRPLVLVERRTHLFEEIVARVPEIQESIENGELLAIVGRSSVYVSRALEWLQSPSWRLLWPPALRGIDGSYYQECRQRAGLPDG